MPADPARFRPETRITELGAEFYDPVPAADFPQTVTRFRNDRWAERLGLGGLSDEEWVQAFGRFRSLPGGQEGPLALRYHGHQFRTYNPDLGDGRGFLYAQLRDPETGRLLDFGTKGSGRTPWSRGGDGRLTLKGGVREVLATEMLEALGVPTSKSFSLIETGEDLVRNDEPSPTRSAVLTRLSHSHIRFGSFQRLAFLDKGEEIGRLVDYVVRLYYPELDGAAAGAERATALLRAVVGKTAALVARWMAAGFVHGVLNTDNMNITGESFDYGPWRFLPKNDPNFTAAYFDQTGLYSFGRQPAAVFWNLQQLGGSLSLVAPANPLIEALNGFSAAYREELRQAMLTRLGVLGRDSDEDVELVNAAFRALAEGGERLRWEPFFFDWFGGPASEARALNGPRAEAYEGEACRDFRARLGPYGPDRPERLANAYFARPAPEEMLYDEVEALWAPIAERDDWRPFYAKLAGVAAAREAYAINLP